MPEIAISNSKGRDASVVAESVRVPMKIWWIDAEERIATSAKVLKGTLDRDYDALLGQYGAPEKVAEAIVEGDPEIDLESVGRYLRDTSRIYVNSDRQVVYGVNQIDVVRNPDGTEKLRRPKKAPVPNVSAEQPLLWSGKLLPKKDVFNKFVMVSKQQLMHVNGLTYDFLYDIAKELEAKKSLLLLGAGPKSNQPLILRRGAAAYRGFLEGRTRGAEYLLLLHLSNIELKAPEATAPPTEVTQS